MSHEKQAVVAKLLENTKLLDWTIPVMFFHLPENLSGPITHLLKKKAGKKLHTHTNFSTLYIMDKKGQKGVPLRYTVLGCTCLGVNEGMDDWL